MMTDPGTTEVTGGGVPHIKKELENSFQECSPSNSDMYSPTTTVMHDVSVSTIHVSHIKYLSLNDMKGVQISPEYLFF